MDASRVLEPTSAPELQKVGLRWSGDTDPGIRRRRAGKGWSYRHDLHGRIADPTVIARIRSLAVPPAWTDVWICDHPDGHLQATGRDARGRKQYRYHPDWRASRERTKFEALAEFGAGLDRLRARLDEDLRRPGLPPERVVALVLTLMDRTLIRVGNEEYRRANGTYGLTTLCRQHVEVDGCRLRFRFTGKGGLRHEVGLTDRRLATLVRRCHELGGREVFTYLDGDQVVRVDSEDCNDYLRGVLGGDTTVKTFRTWGASAIVTGHLAATDPPESETAAGSVVLDAVDAAAARLGNTRAVARRSYVHPRIETAWREGDLAEAWSRSRDHQRLDRAEVTLARLLGGDR
jgi:DNA topoisomerase-1